MAEQVLMRMPIHVLAEAELTASCNTLTLTHHGGWHILNVHHSKQDNFQPSALY